MKVAALEFRVADKFFAIEMSKVKHFFEVENLMHLDFLPDFVEGIVRYNNNVYPLISLKKAWNIDDGKKEDIAVAIVFKEKEYAVLIDEIIKIDELEKKENFLIEVFEENGKLIGNLNLDFLDDFKIPTFLNKNIEKKEEKKNIDKESFLLFECNDEILAVETSLVKKIEDYEKDILIINEMVINLTDQEKIYKKCDKKNILILEDEKVIAFAIGNIIDIYLIDKNDITLSNDGMFNKYFLFKSKEVKVFSSNYLKKLINKYGSIIKKDKIRKFDEKIEILLLNICGEKFAIRMSNVVDINEYNEVSLNFANDNPHVKGIVTTREGATYILSFENILKKESKISEDSKIIIIKNEKHLKAILVDGIDDIIYVKSDHILITNKSDNIIGGMVINNDEMIPLINIDWPKDL
ncbi:chemotaxis protein CheW [Nautilia lithotrophica]